MVERRFDDTVRLDAFRSIQSRNLGGAGDQLARLRLDLQRTLHGPAKDNPAGYDDSIVSAAGNLHGSLLLVHGTSDDNVHFQNTIQMTDALIKAGKQFRLMVYPAKRTASPDRERAPSCST